MWSGTVITVSITSPEGMGRMLRTRRSNQAIAHGVCDFEGAYIVTKGNERISANGDAPKIARTREYFSYSDGPALLMFDHDKPRDNSNAETVDALKSYRPDELLEVLATVHPELASAASVSTPC